MNRICKEFFQRHNLFCEQVTEHEAKAIYLLESSREHIQAPSHMDDYAGDWVWELSQAMLYRTCEYVASALVLFLSHQFPSVEIVSRTAIESAINLMYVLETDKPLERFMRYFSVYVQGERRQNRLWKKSIEALSQDEKAFQIKHVAEKDKALDNYEEFLKLLSFSAGISYEGNAKWPNLSDRFKAIGKEVDYRTVYASLCSQAHSDAEDLLNRTMAYSLEYSTGRTGLGKQVALEAINFSLKSIYGGLQYYIEAGKRLAEHFSLSDVIAELDHKQEEVVEAFVEISFGV